MMKYFLLQFQNNQLGGIVASDGSDKSRDQKVIELLIVWATIFVI